MCVYLPSVVDVDGTEVDSYVYAELLVVGGRGWWWRCLDKKQDICVTPNTY